MAEFSFIRCWSASVLAWTTQVKRYFIIRSVVGEADDSNSLAPLEMKSAACALVVVKWQLDCIVSLLCLMRNVSVMWLCRLVGRPCAFRCQCLVTSIYHFSRTLKPCSQPPNQTQLNWTDLQFSSVRRLWTPLYCLPLLLTIGLSINQSINQFICQHC